MIITQTPLRISLLGGNTDFPEYFNKYGGTVITATINKYIFCIINKRFDNQIWVNYSKKEIVNKVADIKHDLVREALKLLKVEGGIEITFLSDIPSTGSGLGSSSAVLIGLLNALHAYKNESVDKLHLAREAIKIELDILKKPIGVQDQHAIAFGGCNKLNFRYFNTEYMPLSDHFEALFKDNLMLFYTGQGRKAEKILKNMKLDTKILDENKMLVAEGLTAMKYYNLSLFAQLLNKYWRLKKKLNKATSNSKIDLLYSKARRAGALGGKIVGAGGGGFLLLIVPQQLQDSVRNALKLKELPFNLERSGSKVIFNNG